VDKHFRKYQILGLDLDPSTIRLKKNLLVSYHKGKWLPQDCNRWMVHQILYLAYKKSRKFSKAALVSRCPGFLSKNGTGKIERACPVAAILSVGSQLHP